MGRATRGLATGAVLLVLAGCGNPTSARPGVASTAGAVQPPPVLIVVAEVSTNQLTTIRLFREDGSEAGHFGLKQNERSIAAAGARVFFVSDNHLKALRRDGTIEDLQVLADGSGDPLPSPDGTRWVWTTMKTVYDGYSSTVYISQPGGTPRAIETLTDAATWLLPLRWAKQGPLVQRMGGIDGYFVFGLPVLQPLQRIDPDRGAVIPVALGTCTFADDSADGTIACFGSSQSADLQIVSKAGHVTRLSLSKPRFSYEGDVYFSPDGKTLSVAGAAGVGASMGNPNPQPEQFGTDLILVSDGSIRRFGPAGVRLAMGWRSWLPDGKLVLWRPPGAAGGEPGFYVLDPGGSGQGPETRVSGFPLGYLTG